MIFFLFLISVLINQFLVNKYHFEIELDTFLGKFGNFETKLNIL